MVEVKKIISFALAQLLLFNISFAVRPMATDESKNLKVAPPSVNINEKRIKENVDTSEIKAESSDARENIDALSDVESQHSNKEETLNKSDTEAKNSELESTESDDVEEAISLEELQQEIQKISRQLNDLNNARVSSNKELNSSLKQLSETFTKQIENAGTGNQLNPDEIKKLQEVLAQIKDINTPEKPRSFISKALGFVGSGLLLPFKLFGAVLHDGYQMLVDICHVTIVIGVPAFLISVAWESGMVTRCHKALQTKFKSFQNWRRGQTKTIKNAIELLPIAGRNNDNWTDPLEHEKNDDDQRMASMASE